MAKKIRSDPLVAGRLSLLAIYFVVVLLCENGRADEEEWRVGRATYYGENHEGDTDGFSIHHGSCQFGKLDPNVGTGWDIAAIPDVHPEYQGSCGKCYELACEGMVFSDNYGESLDRTDACYAENGTVIVTVVDSCPCEYAENFYSNKRWCCGDMDHFDISIFAFEKLAPMKNGVIGLKYRPVPCPSYDEFKPADPNMIVPGMGEDSTSAKPSKSNTRVSRESSDDSTSTKVPIDDSEGEDSTERVKEKDSVTIVSSDPLAKESGKEQEEEEEEKSVTQRAKDLAKAVLKEEVEKDKPNRDKVLSKKAKEKSKSPTVPPVSAEEPPKAVPVIPRPPTIVQVLPSPTLSEDEEESAGVEEDGEVPVVPEVFGPSDSTDPLEESFETEESYEASTPEDFDETEENLEASAPEDEQRESPAEPEQDIEPIEVIGVLRPPNSSTPETSEEKPVIETVPNEGDAHPSEAEEAAHPVVVETVLKPSISDIPDSSEEIVDPDVADVDEEEIPEEFEEGNTPIVVTAVVRPPSSDESPEEAIQPEDTPADVNDVEMPDVFRPNPLDPVESSEEPVDPDVIEEDSPIVNGVPGVFRPSASDPGDSSQEETVDPDVVPEENSASVNPDVAPEENSDSANEEEENPITADTVIHPSDSDPADPKESVEPTKAPSDVTGGGLGVLTSALKPPVDTSKQDGDGGKAPGVLTRLSRSSSTDTTSTRGRMTFGPPTPPGLHAMIIPTIVDPQTVPHSASDAIQGKEKEVDTDENEEADSPSVENALDDVPSELMDETDPTDDANDEGDSASNEKEVAKESVSEPVEVISNTPEESIEITAQIGRPNDSEKTSSSNSQKESGEERPQLVNNDLPKKPNGDKNHAKSEKPPKKLAAKKSAPSSSPPPPPALPKQGPMDATTKEIMTNATAQSQAPFPSTARDVEKCSAKTESISIYDGGFDDCFVDGGLLKYSPVNSHGFEGKPAWCTVLGSKRSVAVVSVGDGVFEGKTKFDFYLMTKDGCPDIALFLVGKKGVCGPINVKNMKHVDEKSEYKKFSVDLGQVTGVGSSVFGGCELNSAKDVYAISFKNNLETEQGVCFEEMKLY